MPTNLVSSTKHSQIGLCTTKVSVVAVLSIVRLTGLAAGNATGEKLPLFVIGKPAKPRCFSGVKSLPCRYRSQKNSWMYWDLFTEWVKELDGKFKAQGRKIALIVNNCPSHLIVDGMKAIELSNLSTTEHNVKNAVVYGSRCY